MARQSRDHWVRWWQIPQQGVPAMSGKRAMRPDEVDSWLSVLLDAAFDPSSRAVDLDRSAKRHNTEVATKGGGARPLTARDGRCQLLSLASDFTTYPGDYTDQRRAELLLAWVARWVLPEEWTRLASRVRKRRERAAKDNAMTKTL